MRHSLFWLALLCAVPVMAQTAGQETVVIPVRNFGKPMEPIAPAFTNDPERIVLSENFYSNQPGARQNRNGLISAFNYASLTTGKVDAITTFGQQGDSAAIVFMAGGRWWWTFYGSYAAGKLSYVSSLAAPREIRPYTPGKITNLDTGISSQLLQGSTPNYFARHLQPGDTLYLDSPTDTCVVGYLYGDNELRIDTLNGIDAHTADTWDARRTYRGTDPWLYASGQYVYSGSVKDAPQVIYNKDDTLFIRPLIMVDSFYVDKIRNTYTDSLNGSVLRRSYEVAGVDTCIVETQLISRRANWLPDQWLTSEVGSPVTYFVRIGWWNTGKKEFGRLFTVRGNTDTSIYLASWYRDSVINGLSTAELDSLQMRRADTMSTNEWPGFLGHWAYIYTSVGAFDVVLPDASTPVATLFGRGAIWKVVDPAPAIIDTSVFVNNLCFIRSTSDDIAFPSYTAGYDKIFTYVISRIVAEHCTDIRSVNPLTQDQLPISDTIIAYREETEDIPGPCNIRRGIWTIRSHTPKRPVQAQYVNNGFYPIRFARRIGDTLFFVTSAANIEMVADTSRDTTSNWEIVKVGMPSWDGMTSWGNPSQLAAWGDTSSLSLISFAQPQVPWNWTISNDVNVGLDLNDPLVALLGFDDQLLAFKKNSIVGYTGNGLKEISQGDGLIARDAVTSDNKFAYFLDVDGPKVIARRDFSGYTIQPIGFALDPVFNTWSVGNWGTSVVPFYMNPAYKNQAVLRYNEFDKHLYLSCAMDSSAVNNRTLTYSVPRQEWDGIFTYGASAAMPFTWKDTSCILLGKGDTSMVVRTSLNWNDNGVGITSTLKSGRFWVTAGDDPWPYSATLKKVRFAGRGSDVISTTIRLVVSANNSVGGSTISLSSDSVAIDMPSSVADGQFTWEPSSDLTGTYWDWKIYEVGGTTGTLFAPYEMLFEFSNPFREK